MLGFFERGIDYEATGIHRDRWRGRRVASGSRPKWKALGILEGSGAESSRVALIVWPAYPFSKSAWSHLSELAYRQR
jgi:hypothetical protein